jgi:hypothetical protein
MARNAPPFLLLAVLLGSAPLAAQEATTAVALHGFGSWAYGRTNDNVYLSGAPEGDFRRVSMSFNLAARVSDRLTIHAQTELFEDEDGTHASLSYAFADYRLSDSFSFRVGQVKHPFGIYTEILAVGTLRPFLDLPQGFYGSVGFAGESYKGIGISGTRDAGSWTLAYDLYAGGTDLRKNAVPEEFYNGSTLQNVSRETELQSTRNVVGGRLVLQTPLEGLSFGGSTYTGVLNDSAARHLLVVAAQLRYRSNKWTIESEVAHEDGEGDERAIGGYVQAAYRLTPRWQVAAQGDYLYNQFLGVDTTRAPSLQHHREGAVALSYWVSRAFVIKAEYHRVNGNRFAMPHPENLMAVLDAGQLHTTTHLFQFGAQFSF